MNGLGGIGGVQEGPHHQIQPAIPGEGVKWKSRSIKKLEHNLDSIAEKINGLAGTKQDFHKHAEAAEKLLGEISALIHTLETPSSPKEANLLANIRKKANESLQELERQIQSTAVLPNIHLETRIAALRKDNLQRLEQLKHSLQKTETAHYLALEGITSNKSIGDDLNQIRVLSQYEDATTSGFENCGYHALKNALIALLPDQSSEKLEAMFNDKELFLQFYQQYCAPVVNREDKSTEKLDASAPILREIIQKFADDRNPPKPLIPLQAALRGCLREDSLAIFQMSTTTGDDTGSPFFGFFDDLGTLDALKIYDLANKPGPRTISCVFGNEALGHWYTLTIHKTKGGQYSFFGSDSMDNAHDITGIYSALGKITQLIQSKIKNHEEFLKEAFEPIHDFLSSRAHWFESDGKISKEFEANLMDNSPVPTLASPEAPSGSTLERNIAQCLRAFEVMEAGGWIASRDYWVQLQVGDLEKIVNFYLKNIPAEHPARTKLQEVSDAIKEKKRANIIEETFQDALSEIEDLKDRLTAVQYERTKSTFTHMRTLFRESRALSQIEDENERIRVMNSSTGMSGVEEGFTVGKKSSNVEKSLMEKVHLLLLAYQMVKRSDSFDKMIKTISSGDPCLTARIGRVNLMFTELQGLGKIPDIAPAEKVREAPVTALSEAIREMADSFLNTRAKEIIDSIFSNNPEKAITILKDYAAGDLGKPFRDFLVREGLISKTESRGGIPEADEIDWISALPKILENRDTISTFISGDPNNRYDTGDKEQRFSIEVRSYLSKISPALLQVEDNFDILVMQFQTFASGERAELFRQFLMDKSIIPDTKVSHWEDAVVGIIKMDEFNLWLSLAKAEASKDYEP